jgi:hypothetical protein
MATATKKILINMCIALISLSGSLVIGYYAYRYMERPSEQMLYRGADNEYLLSFYNRKGQKISDPGGMLKIITDPFTIYANYPNQKTPSYSINRYGFREGYESVKPYIAIVIGGSAAFGFALDSNDKTFSSKLSLYNKKYNIFNSAVVGFLSGQELSQMIHYLDDFRPSLYIVFDGWNDIYDPYTFANTWPVRNAPIGYNNAFIQIEAQLAEYFLARKKNKNSQKEEYDAVGTPLGEEEFFQKILHEYISNVVKMHDFTRSRGAECLIVFQPELGSKKNLSLDEQEVLRTWIEKYGYLDKKITERYMNLVEGAKSQFQERNISFIDINAQPEFTDNPRTVFFDVVHPNELGHELIARIINRALEEKF